MDLDSPPSKASESKPISPASRIAELNAIDKTVSELLHAASESVKLFTGSSPPATEHASTPSLSNQKAAFKSTMDTYFTLLSSIEVRLRRQIYALEEAGLIDPGSEADAKRGRAITVAEASQWSEGGGPLDASWLNARAGDKIGEEIERELWAKARELVKGIEEKSKEDVEMGMGDDGDEKRKVEGRGEG